MQVETAVDQKFLFKKVFFTATQKTGILDPEEHLAKPIN
jgi:hypothetical protein